MVEGGGPFNSSYLIDIWLQLPINVFPCTGLVMWRPLWPVFTCISCEICATCLLIFQPVSLTRAPQKPKEHWGLHSAEEGVKEQSCQWPFPSCHSIVKLEPWQNNLPTGKSHRTLRNPLDSECFQGLAILVHFHPCKGICHTHHNFKLTREQSICIWGSPAL